jgi:yeast amino acid transporter
VVKFILLSVIIGSGVFTNNGQALEVAGPMGLVLCVVIQGFIAAFVGETVSELVQVFPAPNALYAYVEMFVDEDLGWIASIAHW